MPFGFSGAPTVRYLSDVEKAIEQARAEHNIDPFANLSNRAVTPPGLPVPINEEVPYLSNGAESGGNTVGAGSSSNIVVREEAYRPILQDIDQADDEIAEALFAVGNQIIDLCETTFVLPRTVPKIMEISQQVIDSLSGFRNLTGSIEEETNNFIGSVLGVGGGGENLVWNEANAEDIRFESDQTMRKQAANMNKTVSILQRTANNLVPLAEEQEYISRTAMRTEWRSDSEGNSYTVSVPDTVARAIAANKADSLREQISLLGIRAGALQNNGIVPLESELNTTNSLFEAMNTVLVRMDSRDAQAVSEIQDEMNAYIAKMNDLQDGIWVQFNADGSVRVPSLEELEIWLDLQNSIIFDEDGNVVDLDWDLLDRILQVGNNALAESFFKKFFIETIQGVAVSTYVSTKLAAYLNTARFLIKGETWRLFGFEVTSTGVSKNMGNGFLLISGVANFVSEINSGENIVNATLNTAGIVGIAYAAGTIGVAVGTKVGGVLGGILGTVIIPIPGIGTVTGAALGALGGAVFGAVVGAAIAVGGTILFNDFYDNNIRESVNDFVDSAGELFSNIGQGVSGFFSQLGSALG